MSTGTSRSYLSRRTIEDSPSAISEHDIGCNVLGRRPDFNANEDNIVRVQVRHLRKKLEDYFGTEGLEEQLILVIPKGGYVPRFEPRTTQPAQRPAVGAELIYTEPGKASEMAPPPAKASYPWRVVAVLSVLVATLAVTAIILWRQKEALRLGAPVSGQSAAPPGDVLWSKMFASGQEVTVVASDTCFVMLQDILDLDIPLSEYLSGAYPLKFISSVHDRKLREALQLISSRSRARGHASTTSATKLHGRANKKVMGSQATDNLPRKAMQTSHFSRTWKDWLRAATLGHHHGDDRGCGRTRYKS